MERYIVKQIPRCDEKTCGEFARLGAATVFVFKSVKRQVLDSMLGFAAGVMIAASYWSLLAPAIEMAAGEPLTSSPPASSRACQPRGRGWRATNQTADKAKNVLTNSDRRLNRAHDFLKVERLGLKSRLEFFQDGILGPVVRRDNHDRPFFSLLAQYLGQL